MSKHTRRSFAGQLAMLGMAPMAAAGPAPPATARERLPVDELNLPAEVLADLKTFAEPVLAQAHLLEELPLKGVDPGFRFEPQ
jgi:hypothetical protein